LAAATVLNNVGLVYEDQGEPDKALEAFLSSASIAPRYGGAIVNICRNYEFRNEHEKALDYCQRGLTTARERGDKTLEAGALGMMAVVHLSLGNINEALKDSKAAVELLETIDESLRGTDPRLSFHSFTTNYYALLINVLSNLHRQAPTAGYDVTAFELSERARARGLVELLSNARVDLRQGVDPALLQREKEIQHLLNSKERYRAHLLFTDRHSTELSSVESEVGALVIEQQELIAKIRSNSPRYSALTKPAPLSLKEIQRTVVDDDTVLLEYHLGEKAVLWAVTPNAITLHLLPSESEVEAMARRVYDSLSARNVSLPNETLTMRLARVETAEKEYESAAASLSKALLGPVANQLGRKRLVFVTDGLLQYIPFAALPIPEAKAKPNSPCTTCRYVPLITEHEIVSLPSASVLSVLRKEISERRRAPKEIAVVADPVFSINDPRITSTFMRESDKQRTNGSGNNSELESQLGTTGFGRLRFSREEADSIASLVPPNETFKLTGLAATKQAILTANLDQYRILHFATHSVSNTRWPELSGVVFSLVNQQGEPEDGFLRLNESL
jgi:CHAT domain-containing protein